VPDEGVGDGHVVFGDGRRGETVQRIGDAVEDLVHIDIGHGGGN